MPGEQAKHGYYAPPRFSRDIDYYMCPSLQGLLLPILEFVEKPVEKPSCLLYLLGSLKPSWKHYSKCRRNLAARPNSEDT